MSVNRRAGSKFTLPLASVLLIVSVSSADPLTYQKAVQLTVQHSADLSSSVEQIVRKCDTERGLYVSYISSSSAIGNILNFLPYDRSSSWSSYYPTNHALNTFDDTRLKQPEAEQTDLIRCTALAFAAVGTLNTEARVIDLQQAASARLMDVEERRVRLRVDDPSSLTQAKLSAAQGAVMALILESSSKAWKQRLALLIGSRDLHFEPDLNSVPNMPQAAPPDTEMVEKLKQMSAARDVVALDYSLAITKRKHMEEQSVVGKANLGQLLEALIAEYQELDNLIEANFELQAARLETVAATRQLLLGEADASVPLSFDELGIEPAAPNNQVQSKGPAVRFIMITPGIPTLASLQPRQFSAMVTYANNTARDESLNAEWDCSNEFTAVVSSTGLLTGLSPGEVMITVRFSGVAQSRHIFIAPGKPESF